MSQIEFADVELVSSQSEVEEKSDQEQEKPEIPTMLEEPEAIQQQPEGIVQKIENKTFGIMKMIDEELHQDYWEEAVMDFKVNVIDKFETTTLSVLTRFGDWFDRVTGFTAKKEKAKANKATAN